MYPRGDSSYDDAVQMAMGVPLVDSIIVVFMVCVQSAAGGAIWSTIRRGTVPIVEFVGMGFALGTVIATLGSQVTLATLSSGAGWLLSPALGALAFAGIRLGWWEAGQSRGIPRREWWSYAPTLIFGLIALVPSLLLTPLRNGYVVGNAYQPDTIYWEALSQSLAVWGPNDSSMLVGEPIRYHWLVYGWIGNLTLTTGAGDFLVMTRLYPVLILVATMALAGAWARILTRIWWVPGFAALLVAFASYVGASQGVVLNYDSPSTSYAIALGLAFGIVFSALLRSQVSSPLAGSVVLGLLAFTLMGAKASQGAVVAAGILVVGVWAMATGRLRRTLPLGAATAVGLGAGFVVFWVGIAQDETNIGLSETQEHASTFQGLDPAAGTAGIALGTAALLLAVLPRWLGSVWLVRRLPGEFAFVVGLAVAAIGTLVVLRSGTNAAWFALSSTALMTVIAAVGVGIALQRVSYTFLPNRWLRDPVIWAAIAAMGINGIVLVNYALAAVSGARVLWRGPVFAWSMAIFVALVLARSSLLAGGRWLRWAAMVTVVLTLVSVGARANAPIVWGIAHSRATPAVQDFIRLFDPDAEFTANVKQTVSARSSGLRAANASIRADDQRGASDGVARRDTIIQWTPSMNQTALLLRELSDRNAVIAVSRPSLQPFLPIVSERRTWLAGLPYTTGYTTANGIATADYRGATVEALLNEPSDSLVNEMKNAGVQWLWVTPESFPSLPLLAEWTEVVASDQDVALLRFTDQGANSS